MKQVSSTPMTPVDANTAKRDIPCPVQRALARAGHIGENVPLGKFGELVAKAFGSEGAAAETQKMILRGIGAVANGVLSIPRNIANGFRPHELRGGPLDKRGGGTRILSQQGKFDPAEWERFETFGKQYPKEDGDGTELGWGSVELKTYLDANQARGKGSWWQRHVLAQEELPALLRMMGRGEEPNRHLVAKEVKALYQDELLPARIEQRIANVRAIG
jgi:hypothetical protein